MNRQTGFTLIELMVTIAILAIVSAVALPNLNQFLVKMRVDNEISELHRLLLTARNAAINQEQTVTICPLNSQNTCTNNWHNQISIFTDPSNIGILDNDEQTIKIKSAIKTGDKLQFSATRLSYTPSGSLSTSISASNFTYCPKNYSDNSRGISVSPTGRVYPTSDNDNDGKDETRGNTSITCS